MVKLLDQQSDSYASKWISGLDSSAPISSNIGAGRLPFQRWFRFKEAFSPEFVRQSILDSPYEIKRVLDPFGGSGTTAMTCRILGIDSVSIEVNPFLSDLIQAKVTPCSASKFSNFYTRLINKTKITRKDYLLPSGAPGTLVEPGLNGRYVFDRPAFAAIRALNRALTMESDCVEKKLAKVALGSVVVSSSNVIVNGKGRRYRKNWQNRRTEASVVLDSFENACQQIADDLIEFHCYRKSRHVVYNSDARSQLRRLRKSDLVVFSPPYPNSFDYTDVYNLELWMLGYFSSRSDNSSLRKSTLRSHVQVHWESMSRSPRSRRLSNIVDALTEIRHELWNKNIPQMINGYFCDLEDIFRYLLRILPVGGRVRIAVGDSQYAGIKVDVPQILGDLVPPLGYEVVELTPIRAMRSSAQHGGAFDLLESAVTFKKI